MNSTETPSLPSEFSSHSLRAITARFANPDDPLAVWKTEFEDWCRAIQEFKQFERAKLDTDQKPTAHSLRQHRYLLFLLRSRGEELALVLAETAAVPSAEIEKLTGQVDAFLEDLWMSWIDWHQEVNPIHREMLTKFFR